MTKSERKEALMRIVVAIITGIILSIWKALVQILSLINFFYTLITAQRSKDLAEFCEYWNTEMYRYVRYLTFVTNERPWPFTKMQRMSKFKK